MSRPLPLPAAPSSRARADGETAMRMTRQVWTSAGAALAVLCFVAFQAAAHKDKHTPEQLKVFEEVFLEQVRIGDLLFHGDADTQKKMDVQLSRTGMSCAMC